MQHVAVVGAGLVGASAALGLAQQGFLVTLIEHQVPQLQLGELGIDIRNVALTPASREFLDKLGVWERTTPGARSFDSYGYVGMYVWEQWGSGHIDFAAADLGCEYMGWVVEASPLTLDLWQACSNHPNITIELTAITDMQVDEGCVALDLQERDQCVNANFVIAADGARSAVRNLFNVGVFEHEVNQSALATVVQHALPHGRIARQRFLVDGPLALLPSHDGHTSSVVWSQSTEQAKVRRDTTPKQFCEEMTALLEHCVGDIEQVDRRIVFPLAQQRVKSLNPHPRILFVGDAMRVVHPLAGMGVNLGFEDVVELLQVARGQSDLGRPGLWQRYERARANRSAAMIQTMSMFKTLFSSDLPGAALLRKAGMTGISALPGLKQQIMREAMGLGRLGK